MRQELSADRANVKVHTFTRPAWREVEWRSDEHCVINYALWPRPTGARARYKERFSSDRFEAIGEVVFAPTGLTLAAGAAAGPRRHVACHLSAGLFRMDWEALTDRALVECLALRAPEVRRDLKRLLLEVTCPGLAGELAVDAAAALLAIDIERHLTGIDGACSIKKGGLSPVRMRRIEDRLRAEPAPSLTELAAYCGLSVRQLTRAFRQETGQGIGDYVDAIGRERAFTLLRTTDLPIARIAERVGFSNPASFSYAFRRATGLRPSDVRRRGLPDA